VKLSLRTSRLRAAAFVGRLEALTPERRFAFLRDVMANGYANVTEAAAWRVCSSLNRIGSRWC